MSEQRINRIDPCQAEDYQIQLQGHLDAQWSTWFNGMTITLEDNGNTIISGRVTDQAALHGLLRKVRDLGMVLLSVRCLKVALLKNFQTETKAEL